MPALNDDTHEQEIITLHSLGDWESLLANHKPNKFLPWIWPSLEDLLFISESAQDCGCSQIVSIGCGSGLFEWLLMKATGFAVKGVEVDRSWWGSKYCVSFLSLEFAEDFDKRVPIQKTDALLFCYFNNQPAFLDYINNYTGSCLIVIGPGPDRGTHTDPTPFLLPEPAQQIWKMDKIREISSGKDFIAIFRRTS